MSAWEFKLFADYFQFYLQDEPADGDLSDSWFPEAVDRMLAIAPGTIGVMTARDADVPVVIELCSLPPVDDFDGWDQINECSIEIKSGKMVVAGCTEFFPDAARIDINPGHYRVRIYYAGLDQLSKDGLDGEDRYRIALWLAAPDDVAILKHRGIQNP